MLHFYLTAAAAYAVAAVSGVVVCSAFVVTRFAQQLQEP
jgi:hypothetical protein